MRPLLEAIREKRLYLDGGFGSMLQAAGLPEGMLPDIWNLKNPQAVQQIHQAYLEAGCRLLTTNTFGSSRQKLLPYGVSPAEVVTAAVQNVRAAMEAAGVTDAYVCGDIGPTGRLLKPYGDLDFEEAVSLFSETIRAAARAGADAILIETMSDLYEMKAAVVAAKESCDLPVLASLIFDGSGKLLTGGSPQGAVALLEGLGVDVLGINCGLGPKEMAGVFQAMWEASSTPLLLQPNAGLPRSEGGKAVYDVSPQEYAQQMAPLAPMATVMGGCCGTTPAHLQALIETTREVPLPEVTWKDTLLVTSYCQTVSLDGKDLVIIGERINPTGKKKLQAALREGDTGYVLGEALKQEEAGAHILDVNVGLPGLDEPAVLTKTMEAIQEVTGLPLQLDTSNPKAMEVALRRYNGKPLVNSVNGKEESLEAILPLVKKYGGGLVCLTLDDDGIPGDAEGRVAIARKIVARAEALGIPRRELLVDGLTMPVSAGGENANVTLETLRRVKEELGVKTALGVSNVSFGLPKRDQLNVSFFTMALQAGLDGAIMNPMSGGMMGAYRAYRALRGLDSQCQDYMAAFQEEAQAPAAAPAAGETLSLQQSVCKGLKEAAAHTARDLAEGGRDILDIINGELVPALDQVGKGFEQGTLFLLQLLMSAEAAKAAFQVLKDYLPAGESTGEPQIVLATVKGDIHDIGKNIVKVLLESYRFRVLDLGKDVAPETIVETVRQRKIPLVGLSALMTTTAPYMAETIRQLREAGLPCKVVVGGAVITQDYADSIGADRYAADAMESVHYAQEIFG
ncbi:MAG: homocysteine S-methyltransferase family protein [Evtepia sp.]|uniref:homocysteine S-methyltransferase family protein n=1 Tax=Evtepia sp. TaxID=2773933 RepID=UPI002A75C68D|nr:homocysteine S-methyltransferase family protein [Evtepia sp.]MDY3015078.1 homocysteine S-methyltransferase family protein [Evtepia sp.]